MTPAVFPIFILSLTGALPTADLHDYALLRRQPGAGARARASAASRCSRATRARSRSSSIRRKLTGDRPDRATTSPTRCKAQNTMLPGRPLPRSRACSTWCSRPASGQIVDADRGRRRSGHGRRDDPRRRPRHASCRVRRIARCSSPATAATRSSISDLAADRRQHPRRSRAASTRALARSATDAAGRHPRSAEVYDLAEFVADAIANVRDAILIGGLLAVVVLLVFLRDWRLTLVAALTLPLAVVPTFLFMWLFGETINLMSMGGLAVAIGLVIDDAVVVVENIHRAVRRRRRAAVVEARAGADGAAGRLDADHGGRVRAARRCCPAWRASSSAPCRSRCRSRC